MLLMFLLSYIFVVKTCNTKCDAFVFNWLIQVPFSPSCRLQYCPVFAITVLCFSWLCLHVENQTYLHSLHVVKFYLHPITKTKLTLNLTLTCMFLVFLWQFGKHVFTGSIARSATRRYLSYSEADFEVFRPAVATRCTDKGEIWHGWGDRSATFHPHRYNNEGIGPQNWNFYRNLIKMWNINAPQGHIPCAIFAKFADFRPRFSLRQLLKFRWIYSRSYVVMGVLSWRCLVILKFSAPPSGETMHQTPKSLQRARTCSRSSITMSSLVGLGFHPPSGRPKTLVFCLFVCLSVRHAFERQRLCARFRQYRSDFNIVGWGKFAVVHPWYRPSVCPSVTRVLCYGRPMK